MKLVKPSFEIWEQENLYKQIERAGRVCYKSEDKITEDSAKPFVSRLISAKHFAMLEHGTVYLKVTSSDEAFVVMCIFYGNNKYSKITHSEDNQIYYITTNLRVIAENNKESDLKYLCEPTEHHIKRVTVHFVCDNGVAREFCRHRTMSFAQESTRYCNYCKDKFGNELTYILPCWMPEYDESDWGPFHHALYQCEKDYFQLIKAGWQAQQARNVLPLALKTELVMTGFIEDWQHFFNLRALGTTGAPHPQAKELAEPLYKEFINKGYIHE